MFSFNFFEEEERSVTLGSKDQTSGTNAVIRQMSGFNVKCEVHGKKPRQQISSPRIHFAIVACKVMILHGEWYFLITTTKIKWKKQRHLHLRLSVKGRTFVSKNAATISCSNNKKSERLKEQTSDLRKRLNSSGGISLSPSWGKVSSRSVNLMTDPVRPSLFGFRGGCLLEASTLLLGASNFPCR